MHRVHHKRRLALHAQRDVHVPRLFEVERDRVLRVLAQVVHHRRRVGVVEVHEHLTPLRGVCVSAPDAPANRVAVSFEERLRHELLWRHVAVDVAQQRGDERARVGVADAVRVLRGAEFLAEVEHLFKGLGMLWGFDKLCEI